MIVKIECGTGEDGEDYWWQGESLEAFWCGSDSGVELEKVGNMYVVHSRKDWGGNGYTLTFYIADNKREATEKFVEELESLVKDCELSESEIKAALRTVEKYKEYSQDFNQLKQIAEKLIAGEDLWEEPVIHRQSSLEVFEEFDEKLRSVLHLSQDAMECIKELILAYGPHEWNKKSLEVVGSCTYIVVNYKGYNVDKSQIASILQITKETFDALCNEICSSLSLPPIYSNGLTEKEAKFEEELKQHAFELRRLVDQGKSFYCISDSLNIEPKRLKGYLRRLGLKCKTLGWGSKESGLQEESL